MKLDNEFCDSCSFFDEKLLFIWHNIQNMFKKL